MSGRSTIATRSVTKGSIFEGHNLGLELSNMAAGESAEKQQDCLVPLTGKGSMQEVVTGLNGLIKVVLGLTNTVSEMKQSIEFRDKEITDLKSSISDTDKKVNSNTESIQTLNYKCEMLSKKNEKLHNKLVALETQSRRDNLKLCGINEKPQGPGFGRFNKQNQESEDECKERVYKVLINMGVENARSIEFVRCHRLGLKPKGPNAKPRKIIFKLKDYDDRKRIWDKKDTLDGSGIFLEADFPEEVEQRRRILKPIAKAARAEGKEAGVSVDRLIIDDRRYTINDLHKLPDHLQPANLATKTCNNITAFFSPASPLSNFYVTNFIAENGKSFHSSEQLFQYFKAKEFHDQKSMRDILFCSTPHEAYSLGKMIENFNESRWIKVCRDYMRRACQAKFEQDDAARQFLLNTGDSLLAEANPHDKDWSTGLSLRDDNIFNKDRWMGSNWLGEFLTNYRNSLQG